MAARAFEKLKPLQAAKQVAGSEMKSLAGASPPVGYTIAFQVAIRRKSIRTRSAKYGTWIGDFT